MSKLFRNLALVVVIFFSSCFFAASGGGDYPTYRDMGPFVSYWPEGQPPNYCVVIVKHHNGSVELVELRKKLGKVRAYFIKDLPDTRSGTLYKVFNDPKYSSSSVADRDWETITTQ